MRESLKTAVILTVSLVGSVLILAAALYTRNEVAAAAADKKKRAAAAVAKKSAPFVSAVVPAEHATFAAASTGLTLNASYTVDVKPSGESKPIPWRLGPKSWSPTALYGSKRAEARDPLLLLVEAADSAGQFHLNTATSANPRYLNNVGHTTATRSASTAFTYDASSGQLVSAANQKPMRATNTSMAKSLHFYNMSTSNTLPVFITFTLANPAPEPPPSPPTPQQSTASTYKGAQLPDVSPPAAGSIELFNTGNTTVTTTLPLWNWKYFFYRGCDAGGSSCIEGNTDKCGPGYVDGGVCSFDSVLHTRLCVLEKHIAQGRYFLPVRHAIKKQTWTRGPGSKTQTGECKWGTQGPEGSSSKNLDSDNLAAAEFEWDVAGLMTPRALNFFRQQCVPKDSSGKLTEESQDLVDNLMATYFLATALPLANCIDGADNLSTTATSCATPFASGSSGALGQFVSDFMNDLKKRKVEMYSTLLTAYCRTYPQSGSCACILAGSDDFGGEGFRAVLEQMPLGSKGCWWIPCDPTINPRTVFISADVEQSSLKGCPTVCQNLFNVGKSGSLGGGTINQCFKFKCGKLCPK